MPKYFHAALISLALLLGVFCVWGNHALADIAPAVQLTNDPGDDEFPRWAPIDNRMAFYRRNLKTIWTMETDGTGLGTNLTQITTDGGSMGDWTPEWRKPDGSEIYFVTDRNAYWDIMRVPSAGGLETFLWRTPGGGSAHPDSSSPDGNEFAFVYERPDHTAREVRIADADFTQVRTIFTRSGGEPDPAIAAPCSWSPDGSKIAFGLREADSLFYLALINPDGTGLTLITEGEDGVGFPSWSPDGTKIAFTADRNGNRDIWVINVDGTNRIQITDNPADDIFTTWSADGTKIAFQSIRSGNWDIWAIDVSMLYSANVAVLSLDGDGDYVEIVNSPTLNNLDTQVTIEVWFKVDEYTGDWMPIIFKGDKRDVCCPNRSFTFMLDRGGERIQFASAPNGENQIELFSQGGFIQLHTWYHLAGVIDTITHSIKLLINGLEVASSGYGDSIRTSSLPMRIGWTHEEEIEAHSFFAGLIDEVRIWNVARSQSDIQATMNRPLTGNEPGLVGYWRFDALEDLGVGGDGADDVRDMSGNGNHGDLVGDAQLVPADDLPLPIELASFAASTSDDGVTLNWRTATETNNLGFNIYRSDTKDGKYIKVNARLIAGAGSDATPHDYSFTDENVVLSKTYYYYIEDVDFTGKTNKSHIIEVTVGKQGIKTHPIPPQFALLQNYPNPFNPETWIPFKLAQNANVVIHIYNAKVQPIRTINFGERGAGNYITKDKAAYWDGKNDFGERVSSGVYFYTLQAGGFKATRRMLIVK